MPGKPGNMEINRFEDTSENQYIKKFQTKGLKMRGIKKKNKKGTKINLERPLSAGFEKFNRYM